MLSSVLKMKSFMHDYHKQRYISGYVYKGFPLSHWCLSNLLNHADVIVYISSPSCKDLISVTHYKYVNGKSYYSSSSSDITSSNRIIKKSHNVSSKWNGT